jgi:HSP90 family molecular chaperone
MRRILRAVKREGEPQADQQDLEINPANTVMIRLNQMRQADESLAAKVAEQVLDNARVAAGLLDDPRTMLKRLNELLEQVLATKS